MEKTSRLSNLSLLIWVALLLSSVHGYVQLVYISSPDTAILELPETAS